MIEYRVRVYEDRTVWYKNGQRHREDGPAVVYKDGGVDYWINGVPLTEQEFNERMNPEVELTLEEIAEKFNIPVDKLRVKK